MGANKILLHFHWLESFVRIQYVSKLDSLLKTGPDRYKFVFGAFSLVKKFRNDKIRGTIGFVAENWSGLVKI